MRVLLQHGARGMVIPWNFLEEVGAREEKRVEGMFQAAAACKRSTRKTDLVKVTTIEDLLVENKKLIW